MKKICRQMLAQSPLLFLIAALTGATATSKAGTAKPTVTFTNLKAGQKLTNAEFTVEGQATSKAGITNVTYSVNQGEWNGADNHGLWTNWSAEVTLIPGTNAISAVAVDTNGISSATNTIKVFYVVTTALTVSTNGNGSISPSYNGAQLDLGASYSMKATAARGAKGFGFRNWTDGSNNIITSSATLNFLMKSNLTFVANFGDIASPMINLTSTSPNSDGQPNDFVIHGTAKDNVAVTNVLFQLNGGLWQSAITTNKWTNWTADITLEPGGNTFNAYAMDTSSNVSQVFDTQLIYNSAPAHLAGQYAVVTDTNHVPLFTVAFGKNTFSQNSQNSNYVNGVGTYSYSPQSGFGHLKFKYTAPPIAISRSQYLAMTFYTPSYAYVSITNSSRTNAGYMTFTATANLAMANVANQLIWSVGSQGGASGALFGKKTYTSQDLFSADTNAGTYTYTQYSPVGSLFKLTSTNGTSYVVSSFAGTNYGAYYEEDYTGSGQTNGTDNGHFLIGSQVAGGNAPLTISNRNFEIFSGDGSFNEQFSADTYSQDTVNTNYDNAVGNYSYAQVGTNIGQLNLTATEPPNLAGTTNAARLIFVGGNVGLFTNDDGTMSSFVMTAVTNLAPASITNLSLPIGYGAYIQFTNDGSFVYTVYNNPIHLFSSIYSGTYTYTNFSPGTAMVQLSYLYSNTITGLDWLQLNFKTTNSGNILWSQFDTNNDFTDIYYRGTFTAH